MEGPKLVRTNHAVRTAAYAYCLLVIGLQLWPRQPGAALWTLVVLQFLVYPQLVFWRAKLSSRPTRAELDNLFLDSALLGAWVAYLGFPVWISYALLGSAMLNAAVNRGARGVLLSLGCSAGGAALAGAIAGFHFSPDTSPLVATLCVIGALAYAAAVGGVVYRQNRRLAAIRDEIRRSEDRYRLIAENAADLIAMIDHEGRWLYTSPSYARVLEAQDLAPGADAFRKAHPDDADQARVAVLRAAATGKTRELALRLVDRGGRIHQYKTRIQAIGNGEAAARKLLLVSHDVTDLRESEERLLLAAHALEGMTEAIMITAADGTVVTVNRAFTEITGYTRDDVLGHPETVVRNALQPPEFYDELYGIVQREGYWSGTTWCRRKNGSVYQEWRSLRAVRDAAGAVTHYVVVFYEVGSPRAQAKADSGAGA